MPRFQLKSIAVDAVQWTGDNLEEVQTVAPSAFFGCPEVNFDYRNPVMSLWTAGSYGSRCEVGDWIVRTLNGEVTRMKSDIFAATYEPASADGDSSRHQNTEIQNLKTRGKGHEELCQCTHGHWWVCCEERGGCCCEVGGERVALTRPEAEITFEPNLRTRRVAARRGFDGERIEAQEWKEVDPDLPVIARKGRIWAAAKTEAKAREMLELISTRKEEPVVGANASHSLVAEVGEAVRHELKCWPEFFSAIKHGYKTFEVRRHDRAFKTGDVLVLREWHPSIEEYSGEVIERIVTYVLRDEQFGVKPGFCVMALASGMADALGAAERERDEAEQVKNDGWIQAEAYRQKWDAAHRAHKAEARLALAAEDAREAAEARCDVLEAERDEALDSLRMLRGAWNDHFKTCPPTEQAIALAKLVPTPADVQRWMDAPSDTASASFASSAVPEPDTEPKPICQCWNEGEWGRVHREDCPIHGDVAEEGQL